MCLKRLGSSETIRRAALKRSLKFIARKIPLCWRVGFAPASFDERNKRRRKSHGRGRCGRRFFTLFRIVRRRRTRRTKWHALDDTQVPPEGCTQGGHGFLVSQMPQALRNPPNHQEHSSSLDTGICRFPGASDGSKSGCATSKPSRFVACLLPRLTRAGKSACATW